MLHNVGGLDRIIRAALGVAILGAGFVTHSWWGLIGLVPLLTAAIGWCPIYRPFGLSTCPGPRSRTVKAGG